MRRNDSSHMPQDVGVPQAVGTPSGHVHPPVLHYAAVDAAVAQALSAVTVRVEVSLHRGLPYFDLIGVPAKQALGIKARVTAALKNSGFRFPDQRIVASVTPESGSSGASALDLSVAIALLEASGQLTCPDGLAYCGELSLLGDFVPISGAYNVLNRLYIEGASAIVLPVGNQNEAALVPSAYLMANNLRELVAVVNGRESIDLLPLISIRQADILRPPIPEARLAVIPGQYMARQALKIAAAGRHHMLMFGSVGCGKTSLARVLPALMPRLSDEERSELLAIYSAAGEPLSDQLLHGMAPFRSPHYNITKAALIGGGAELKPGELSLAQRGVLFLDELTEFTAAQLDSLRTALSDRRIELARSRARISLPADVLLIAATNPCPCGNYLEADGSCRCGPGRIKQKLGRLSGAFSDRIDLFVEMQRIPSDEIARTIESRELLDLTNMREEVEVAIHIQQERYRPLGDPRIANHSVDASLIAELFAIDSQALRLAEEIATTQHLSIRAFHKLLRVGRTIADLEESSSLLLPHVAMAAQYRRRNYEEEI